MPKPNETASQGVSRPGPTSASAQAARRRAAPPAKPPRLSGHTHAGAPAPGRHGAARRCALLRDSTIARLPPSSPAPKLNTAMRVTLHDGRADCHAVGARYQITGAPKQDHHRHRCYQSTFEEQDRRARAAFLWKAMETYQWFLLGMMAALIPCFVMLALILRGASGRFRIRRHGRTDRDRP